MRDWHEAVHRVFRDAAIRQVGYVPDAGLSGLIQACHDDPAIKAVVLTSEEEGVGLLAGAWLGGEAGALLMQSSGVGNCVNALSLIATCRMPLLALVAMRGEWGEFNPWQVPMGRSAQAHLESAGIIVQRAEAASEVAEIVGAAARLAFDSGVGVAVLLSQRLIGDKRW